MKTKELIEQLKKSDPKGDMDVVIGNEPVHFVHAEPAYWDGLKQVVIKNEKGNIVGMKYSSEGTKVSIRTFSIQDAIFDDPDFPVEFDIEKSNIESYQKMVNNWRKEYRKMNEEIRKENEMETVKNELGVEIHEGKWGFYPCDHENFKKLKRLNYLLLQTKVQAARWKRWGRKAEQNRKYAEPVLPESLYSLNGISSYDKYRYNWFNHNKIINITNLHEKIENDYKNAKYPKSDKDNVCQLTLSNVDMNKLLSELEEWISSK